MSEHEPIYVHTSSTREPEPPTGQRSAIEEYLAESARADAEGTALDDSGPNA